MGITESNIIKARSGRYKDTEENRRLHRVGQQYGEKKAPLTEMDSKNLSKYDTKTLKNASKAMADKIREMRKTLSTLKMGDMQGDKSAIETVQAKIDSAMNGLVAVNLELAERGAIETTGDGTKKIDLAGWDTDTLIEAIDNSKQTLEIYRRDLEDATTDEERNTLINRIGKQEKRLRSYQEELGKRGDKYAKQEAEFNEKKQALKTEEGGKAVAKFLTGLKDLPVMSTVSIDGKEWTKTSSSYWSSGEKKVSDSYLAVQVFMSKDGDFLVESLPQEELERIDKEHEETKKKAEKQGRVYLGEAPNSSKVNLTKYLSAKAKENIDRILGQVIPTKSRAELITMYDDAVKNFNEGFDDMKKAARANMLYQILTIKAALEGKQGEKADIPLASNMSKEEFADYIASERGAARKAEMEAKMEQIRAEHEQKLNALEEEATRAYKTSGVDKVYVGDGAMDMYWEGGGSLAIQGPSKWRPDQDFTVRVPGVGSVFFNSEQARVFSLAGELLTNTKMKKQALDFLKKFQDIMANTSKTQRETLAQYPDFSSDGMGVRIE